MHNIYKIRLLELAAHLEQITPDEWGYAAFYDGPNMGKVVESLPCGTAACALGHGVLLHGPQEQIRLYASTNNAFGDLSPSEVSERLYGLSGVQHTALFYGISVDYADWCDSHGYRRLAYNATSKDVAAHIRRFVARDGAPDRQS